MPLAETQPDALAHVYARSLFELAEASGGRARVETVASQIEDIIELARRDADFSEFLASRILPAKARAASLKNVFTSRVDDLVLRFLLVLNEKGRLGYLATIGAAFDAITQERFGRVEVDVYTAAPLDPAELNTIKARLAAILRKDAIVHPYTDPSMIGGVKFRIGDQLVDASIATRLRRVRDQLAGRGAAAVRARASKIIDDSGS